MPEVDAGGGGHALMGIRLLQWRLRRDRSSVFQEQKRKPDKVQIPLYEEESQAAGPSGGAQESLDFQCVRVMCIK